MAFNIKLSKDIVGGFVAPKPKTLVEIGGDNNGAIVTFNKYKGSKVTATLQGDLSSEEVHTFASSLENELRGLPTEQPKGSEDIYGLSKSISFQLGNFHWENGAPEGCSSYPSSVQPTPAQKQKFEELVTRLQEFGAQFALQEAK